MWLTQMVNATNWQKHTHTQGKHSSCATFLRQFNWTLLNCMRCWRKKKCTCCSGIWCLQMGIGLILCIYTCVCVCVGKLCASHHRYLLIKAPPLHWWAFNSANSFIMKVLNFHTLIELKPHIHTFCIGIYDIRVRVQRKKTFFPDTRAHSKSFTEGWTRAAAATSQFILFECVDFSSAARDAIDCGARMYSLKLKATYNGSNLSFDI